MSIRSLICYFLVTPWLLSAQGSIFTEPLSSFYPNLQRSLQLNNAQWATLSQHRNEYQTYISSKYERLSQVTQEIQDEKLQPQPDPNALGLRYFEIAAICQESTGRNAAYKRSLRDLLTPQQTTALQKLEENYKQIPALGEAQDLAFLTPTTTAADLNLAWGVTRIFSANNLPGCPGSASVGAFARIASIPNLYPNLFRHLQISESQQQQIQAANFRMQQDLAEARESERRIALEMEAESALPSPRPSLLGENAVRLEQICRTAIALQSGLRQSLSMILNPAQRNLLAELDQAIRLLPMISESQELGMSTRVVPDSLPSPFLAQSVPRRLEWSVGSIAGPNLPGCQAFPTQGIGRWFDFVGLRP